MGLQTLHSMARFAFTSKVALRPAPYFCAAPVDTSRRRVSTIPPLPAKTLARQHEVGKMPVPNLKDTVATFLRSARPFLSDSEMKTTIRRAEEFVAADGVGQKLQGLLKERAAVKENWFSDWWLEMAYLGYRDPLPVWSSPGIAWPKQQFKSQEEQLAYAAHVISGALDFKINKLDNQSLPIEMAGGQPIDMAPWFVLFGTTRLPRPEVDVQSIHPNSKHIIVIHNNNIFKMDVLTSNGEPLTPGDFLAGLKSIVRESESMGTGAPVGILTADDRDAWCENFRCLAKSNSQSLSEIEGSLFSLSLDPDTSAADAPSEMSKVALQSLHGLGSKYCGANRWYDKAIQFFVGSSGQCGMVVEHSPAEAPPYAAIGDHAMRFAETGTKQSSSPNNQMPTSKLLPFQVDDDIRERIKEASEKLDSLVSDVSMHVLEYNNFGKEFVKSHKFSPDSFVQMAIQYAFFRLHNVPGAHYESGGIRRFLHGRTEVIRSCSVESVQFAKAMLDNKANESYKFNAMKNAIAGHNAYARMATSSLAVDRHMQGLRRIATENGLPLPELFEDPGFVRSARMRLSTSQVSSTYPSITNYGVLQMDGYGCCYNLMKNNFLFAISSMRSCPETSSKSFHDALKSSLDEMQEVCDAQQKMAKL